MRNAEGLLETASAPAGNGEPSEWVVLVGPGANIRLLAETDWPLESLRLHHGALMAYRVSRRHGKVRVEGRADRRSCLLERGAPPAARGGFQSRAGVCPTAVFGSPASLPASPPSPAGLASLPSLLRIHRTYATVSGMDGTPPAASTADGPAL